MRGNKQIPPKPYPGVLIQVTGGRTAGLQFLRFSLFLFVWIDFAI